MSSLKVAWLGVPGNQEWTSTVLLLILTLTPILLTLLPFLPLTSKVSTHIWFRAGAKIPILYLPSIPRPIHPMVDRFGRTTRRVVQHGLSIRLTLLTLTMIHSAWIYLTELNPIPHHHPQNRLSPRRPTLRKWHLALES